MSKGLHAMGENGRKTLCGKGSRLAPDPAFPRCSDCRRALAERSDKAAQPRYSWLESFQREFNISTEQLVPLLQLKDPAVLGVLKRQNAKLPKETVAKVRSLKRSLESGSTLEEELAKARTLKENLRAESTAPTDRGYSYLKDVQREFRLSDGEIVLLLELQRDDLQYWSETGEIPRRKAEALASFVRGWREGRPIQEDLAYQRRELGCASQVRAVHAGNARLRRRDSATSGHIARGTGGKKRR